LNWIAPTVSPGEFSTLGRDSLIVQKQTELLSRLPSPCTWQTAAYKHFMCTGDVDPVAASSTFYASFCRLIEKAICTGKFEEDEY
jgi:hypothetical protein